MKSFGTLRNVLSFDMPRFHHRQQAHYYCWRLRLVQNADIASEYRGLNLNFFVIRLNVFI